MSTVPVDADLLREALQLLEDREWDTRNAAENIYCPECVRDDERYKDQQDHHPGCRFVATRDGLRKALEEF